MNATPDTFINPPPIVKLIDYPILIAAVGGVMLTSLLLVLASKFDPSGGTLTLSLLITIGMLSACAYCLVFTIPADDITPGVIGGLTAGFGAVVAHWLGRTRKDGEP